MNDACARIHAHLARGAPWDACDEFRAATANNLADANLLYCGALAHARAGAAHEAHALLDRAQASRPESSQLLADILSLRGRLWKDELHRSVDATGSAALAQRARDDYLAAWSLQRDPYPGINAASLSLLLGDRTAAQDLARTIGARLAEHRKELTSWDHVTLGEVALLLGQPEQARMRYGAAHALAGTDAGSIATMRRQLQLLARVLPDAKAMLEVLRAVDVVAFTGHMVDQPGRAHPRFPESLAPAVEAAVRERIAQMHQPVLYGSAACGADIIVIEAALALGVEVNVVMPFAAADFVRTSVAVGGDAWVHRFDMAMAKVTRIIAATEESYLGDDILFEHAARLVEGLTVLRAAQLNATPRLLCVIDAGAGGDVGGTTSAFERWRDAIGPVELVDVAALRREATPIPASAAQAAAAPVSTPAHGPPVISEPTPSQDALPRTARHSAEPNAAGAKARPPRTLKTLLFADFAGYGRLQDVNAAMFQEEFWAVAARLIASSPVQPRFANTWGDGLYLVFDTAHDGVAFALQLSAGMRAVDWARLGMGSANPIRICLHTGPVFCAFDPVIGRDNYFGSSVTRAARIEPVTPPGTVFVSETCAATLAATGQRDYLLEYVGSVELAKGAGATRVYQVVAAQPTGN